MAIEKFYYDILHIYPNQLSEKEIIKIIEQTIEMQMKPIKAVSDTMEGLCKVASYNIGEQLKQCGINIQYLNTKVILGCFEHVAIIVDYKINDVINYILVDTTFEQFIPKKFSERNSALYEWPSEILENRNPKLYRNLITKGYSKVKPKDYEDYLKSFSTDYQVGENILLGMVLKEQKRK